MKKLLLAVLLFVAPFSASANSSEDAVPHEAQIMFAATYKLYDFVSKPWDKEVAGDAQIRQSIREYTQTIDGLVDTSRVVLDDVLKHVEEGRVSKEQAKDYERAIRFSELRFRAATIHKFAVLAKQTEFEALSFCARKNSVNKECLALMTVAQDLLITAKRKLEGVLREVAIYAVSYK